MSQTLNNLGIVVRMYVLVWSVCVFMVIDINFRPKFGRIFIF